MKTIIRCDPFWELYDLWNRLQDDIEPDLEEIKRVKEDIDKHKRECHECKNFKQVE